MLDADRNHRLADNFTRFVNSRGGLITLGIWAFFEPSFWFIAPDMCLWAMCLYAPRNYRKYFLVTLAAALAGAGFYFLLNLFFFDQLKPILMATPFVHERMFTQIQGILAAYGVKGLLFQAFSFMSVKIWVHVAVQNAVPFFQFILLTGISRALRFFLFALLFSRIGGRLEGWLRKYFIPFVVLYVIGFLSVLLTLETTVGSR